MNFSDRLRLLRNENIISAVELAKRVNKSESAIRMWETGKSYPDALTLIELSKIFDCSTDYLLGLSEFKNESEIIRRTHDVNEFNTNISKLNEKDEFLLVLGINLLINSYLKTENNDVWEVIMGIIRSISAILDVCVEHVEMLNDAQSEVNSIRIVSEHPPHELKHMRDMMMETSIYNTIVIFESLVKSYQDSIDFQLDELVAIVAKQVYSYIPDAKIKEIKLNSLNKRMRRDVKAFIESDQVTKRGKQLIGSNKEGENNGKHNPSKE